MDIVFHCQKWLLGYPAVSEAEFYPASLNFLFGTSLISGCFFFLSSLAYWIAFGPHGPRAEAPKGEGMKVLLKTTQLTVVSILLFYAIHYFAKPQPKTMSKEWQEASNEYARVCLLYSIAISGLIAIGLIGRIPRALGLLNRVRLANMSLPPQSEMINPIHGVSQEGYEGKGFVQSPSAEKS